MVQTSKPSYLDYLAVERLPHIWCPGCGYGIILRSIAETLAELELPPNRVVICTGIGCWSRADEYLRCHAFHGTHGRTLGFATGIHAVRPDLHVFALLGDGDAMNIGGNHFLHAARRNINLTTLVANNFNYAMTGGQVSATTPAGGYTSTTANGNVEQPLDICAVAEAAGATYVARSSVYDPAMINRQLKEAWQNKGFSVLDVLSPCPTYYGRYNGMKDAVGGMQLIKDIAVRTGGRPSKPNDGRLPLGCMVNRPKKDLISLYREGFTQSEEGGFTDER